MARADQYITVTATLLELREAKRSLRIDRDDWFAPVWLPLAALEFHDKITLTQEMVNTTVTLRVEGELAKEKGLL